MGKVKYQVFSYSCGFYTLLCNVKLLLKSGVLSAIRLLAHAGAPTKKVGEPVQPMQKVSLEPCFK